ncbi:MAG: hypothetical protein ACQESR_28880 [Planctomycetota bacterium]
MTRCVALRTKSEPANVGDLNTRCLDLWGGTSGTCHGFDRFGRAVNHLWQDYGASADADRGPHPGGALLGALTGVGHRHVSRAGSACHPTRATS